MTGYNFVTWLEALTGESRTRLARRLGVSPTLLSMVANGQRPVTPHLADAAAQQLSLDRQMVYQKAGLPYPPPAELTEAPPPDLPEPAAPEAGGDLARLQETLNLLRNPDYALEYALAGRLPARSIEKLKRIVALELEYSAAPSAMPALPSRERRF